MQSYPCLWQLSWTYVESPTVFVNPISARHFCRPLVTFKFLALKKWNLYQAKNVPERIPVLVRTVMTNYYDRLPVEVVRSIRGANINFSNTSDMIWLPHVDHAQLYGTYYAKRGVI